MRSKPYRSGRVLAVLLLALGGPACAQILGDDYTIKEGPGGGTGACGELSCSACDACARADECSSEDQACAAGECEMHSDCCFACPIDLDCNLDCDCDGRQQRLNDLEFCLQSACFTCNSSGVTTGGS